MKFVTATLKGRPETRQGWALPFCSGFIIGESGTRYEIDRDRGVTTVTNPPAEPSDEAMAAIGRLR